MTDNIKTTKEIVIDGNLISDTGEFYSLMKLALGDQLLIGSNLDALFDALTTVSYSVNLVIKRIDMLETNLGQTWRKIYQVIQDSLDENYNLSITID